MPARGVALAPPPVPGSGALGPSPRRYYARSAVGEGLGTVSMVDAWVEGDAVSLIAPHEHPRLVRLARGPQRVGEDSVLDLTEQIGRSVGGPVDWLGTRYRAVRPSLSDLLSAMHRGAQIVTPKDAAQILFLAGVMPGACVAEAGSGSGALTLVLANAVGPAGRVVSCDRRADFLENARSNVARAGWSGRVEFRVRDVAKEGWGEEGFSSIGTGPRRTLGRSRGESDRSRQRRLRGDLHAHVQPARTDGAPPSGGRLR